MSQESRKRNRERVIGRREFLKKALLGSLGLGVAAAGVRFGYPHLFEDKWEFLNEPLYTKNDQGRKSLPEVKATGVPFGLESKLDPNSDEFKNLGKELEPILFRRIKEEFNTADFDFEYNIKDQLVAMPANKELVDKVIAYSDIALDFMYDQVPDLTKIDIKWTPVQTGQDFKTNFHGKGLVGSQYHSILTCTALDKYDPEKKVTVAGSSVHHGAKLKIHSRKGYEGQWYIFVPATPWALIAPFSEVIPLSFIDTQKTLSDKYGDYEARVLQEGLSEAMQKILTKQLIRELRIPNGDSIHNKITNSMEQNKIYRLIPAFEQCIQENGMKKTVDVYRSGDPKFFDRIIKSA